MKYPQGPWGPQDLAAGALALRWLNLRLRRLGENPLIPLEDLTQQELAAERALAAQAGEEYEPLTREQCYALALWGHRKALIEEAQGKTCAGCQGGESALGLVTHNHPIPWTWDIYRPGEEGRVLQEVLAEEARLGLRSPADPTSWNLLSVPTGT